MFFLVDLYNSASWSAPLTSSISRTQGWIQVRTALMAEFRAFSLNHYCTNRDWIDILRVNVAKTLKIWTLKFHQIAQRCHYRDPVPIIGTLFVTVLLVTLHFNWYWLSIHPCKNHVDAYCHEHFDPNKKKDLDRVNTEICEQLFVRVNEHKNCKSMQGGQCGFQCYQLHNGSPVPFFARNWVLIWSPF